jgi:hypothetical protein
MTATLVAYHCQLCGARGSHSAKAARAEGWLVDELETIGGSPLSVQLCRKCRPAAAPLLPLSTPHPPATTGWSATCNTCFESLKKVDYPDGVTKSDAEQWCEEHECESETELIEPERSKR